MSKVFIFWDIDGTININGRSKRWNGEWFDGEVTRIEVPALFENLPEIYQSLPLRVSNELLESLAALDIHPNVVNAWLSAWEQDAITVFSPKIGFQNGLTWDSFIAPEGSFTLDPTENVVWWKTLAVREFLSNNPDARVIWIDDLIDDTDEVETANRCLVADSNERLAMVGVMAHLGVTPDSFAFIKRLATEKWQSGVFLFEN